VRQSAEGPKGKNGQLPEAVALVDRIFGTQAQEVTAREVRQLRQSLEKSSARARAGSWDCCVPVRCAAGPCQAPPPHGRA
jgi:hypothetical protein